jgi:hypothetical protein
MPLIDKANKNLWKEHPLPSNIIIIFMGFYASELSTTAPEYFIIAMFVTFYAHRSTTFAIRLLIELHTPSWSGSNENMNSM